MSDYIYNLSGYGAMITDRVRVDAFTEAMRSAIRPGAVVMDIGTGPGIMAILACRLGASRVYAIESSDIVQLAREIAAANQFADKIEFFEDLSTRVTVPVRADVIVSDMRGILPLFGRHLPSIADARQRFLAPGGTLIARKDSIWAAIVEDPKGYRKIVDPWDRNTLEQDLSAGRKRVLNEFHKTRVKSDQLLTEKKLWAILDYARIENPDFRGPLQWTSRRSGTGHGILMWFDMELADGVAFSNGPDSPEAIYGEAFFPWLEPVPLAPGQRIFVEMEAKLLEGDYFWRWTTQIESAEKMGGMVVRYEQSHMQGTVISLAKLRKYASDYVPMLSEEGRIRLRALGLMNGKSSLEEIARRLTVEFPEQFSRWQEALPFAGALSKENSR
jgi:protein arginine N-methyltransferase 1